MSVNGPSGLGTLLVQRLDAVLGTSLSQQTNLVNGARPDAITQTPEAQRNDAAQNRVTRDTREAIDQVQRHGERATRQAVERAKIDAHKSLLEGGGDQPNTRATASAPTTLGAAARTILALLQNFPEQAAVVRGQQPLIQPQGKATQNPGNAPTNTQSSASGQGAAQARGASSLPQTHISSQALAQTLSQTVQSSGLFYESHLSALSFGKYAASALRGEPQAQLAGGSNAQAGGQAPASTSQPAAHSQGTSQPSASNAQPAQTPSTQGGAGSSTALLPRAESTTSPLQQTRQAPASSAANTSTSPGTAAGTGTPGSGIALAALHPETHTLVRQQLEVLANQGFIWKGEAWAGTDLEMHIQRREPDSNEQNADFAHWATRLKLTLPNLGEVDVRLNLNGASLQMAIVAPESAPILKENTPALHQRLDLAGLQLAQITVAQHQAMVEDNSEQADSTHPR
ncbi:flagellar hook-length control protein FliK [Neopusillimonas maritima]|jgi:hypothetical protein|uniref:Flagellar hook-length control protein-like C-terminal domain-containing protein n=1 Tax=Neopusillimonas maritima TaxID=2026239 RepID=A0ABX9MYD3_9BURK|nr:flagellar hook-length control protein FliK [Neopusillimonas maritima]RII83953.1 hypothetical protein CJO09_01565 [Neopusillimonas maritima]